VLAGCVPWPADLAARYRRAGYWRGVGLGALLRGPDRHRVAVVAGGRRVTYGALDDRADRLAAGLADLGVHRGDRVIVQLPNGVAFVETLVALFRLGAVPVLALPAHRRHEIEYLARHSGAVAYVVPDVVARYDHRELAAEVTARVSGLRHVLVAGEPGPYRTLASVDAAPRELPPPEASDVALLLLSGGTTGVPKLVPRTHDDYGFQLRETAAAMGFGAAGVYLAALPAAHNAALGCPGVLGALLAGGRVVLASSPSPDEVFPLVASEGVTLTTLMPAFVALWVDLAPEFGVDLSGVTLEVGGAALDRTTARRVRAELGATLTQWFGMAEGLLCFTRPGDPDELAATTQGRPLSAADELRIVGADGHDVPAGAVGELLCRGPYTLRGYYRAEEHNARAFTPDGFFRTGDLARFTASGALQVTGRVKDVVNRGGEKVSAEEVEEQLLRHPAVCRVAVVAVPDAALGEKTCAVVVPRDGRPTLRELRAYLTALGLAAYKLPDRLEYADALPYTPVGKVDKRALRASL
jgi:2,3-dihydroxybenzoate-AMP ligase